MNNTNERSPQHDIPENAPVPEAVGNNERMLGLTTRLLLGGESINPATQVENVTADTLLLQDSTVAMVTRASSHDRSTFWEGRKETTFDSRVTAWKTETKQAITSLSQRLASDTEKQTRWKDVLSNAGISDMGNVTDTHMQEFYDRYFSGENKASNISKFVEDIAKKYTPEGQPVAYDAFYKDMDAIQWLGNIFGEKIAKTIPSLLEAKLMQNDDAKRTEVATKANQEKNGVKRVNRLEEGANNEKELLSYLWMHGQETQSGITETGEIVRRTPQPVFIEDVPDIAHIDSIPVENAPPPKDYETADKLMDFATGRPKNERVDLSERFARYVESIEQYLDQDTAMESPSVHLALSDVARAMIDRYAQDSNDRDKELVFIVQGLEVERNGKTVLVGAYVIPAQDYADRQREQCNVNARVFEQNARTMARNTNLEAFLRRKTGSSKGSFVSVLHTHQEPLGQRWVANPSNTDYNTAEDNARDDGTFPWGVVTKTGGQLRTKMHYTVHNRNTNQTHHLPLPFMMM